MPGAPWRQEAERGQPFIDLAIAGAVRLPIRPRLHPYGSIEKQIILSTRDCRASGCELHGDGGIARIVQNQRLDIKGRPTRRWRWSDANSSVRGRSTSWCQSEGPRGGWRSRERDGSRNRERPRGADGSCVSVCRCRCTGGRDGGSGCARWGGGVAWCRR